MSNLKNKTGKSALIAMMAVICMIFAMTNSRNLMAQPDCPPGFTENRFIQITIAPNCYLEAYACYRNDGGYVDIYVEELALSGDCIEFLQYDLLSRYEEFMDTVFNRAVKLSPNYLVIPYCPEQAKLVYRLGHPSCVTDPYWMHNYLATGINDPRHIVVVGSCKDFDEDEICWEIATFCWERQGEEIPTLKKTSISKGTEYLSCPAGKYELLTIYGPQYLQCHPVCK